MKSVLRSAFEPIPRPLSPGAQMLLVGVLIFGIAISVVEYLESSRPAALAEDAQAKPARVDPGADSPAPADPLARPRHLVRVAPSRAKPAPAASTGGTSLQAPTNDSSAARGAPMLLQPEEGG
jgi:hypothetical protein